MVLLLISFILMMVTHCRSYQLEAIRVAWSKVVLLKILVVGDGFGWASLSPCGLSFSRRLAVAFSYGNISVPRRQE